MTLDEAIQRLENIEFNDDMLPMKTGKSKSWMGEYHWVSPKRPADTNLVDNIEEMRSWCEQQFGRSGSRWFETKNKFYFKNEEDTTMFVLRWS